MLKFITKKNAGHNLKNMSTLYYWASMIYLVPFYNWKRNKMFKLKLRLIVSKIIVIIFIFASYICSVRSQILMNREDPKTWFILEVITHLLLAAIYIFSIVMSIRHRSLWTLYLKNIVKLNGILKFTKTKRISLGLKICITHMLVMPFFGNLLNIYWCDGRIENIFFYIASFYSVIISTYLIGSFSDNLRQEFHILNENLLLRNEGYGEFEIYHLVSDIYLKLKQLVEYHNEIFGLKILLIIIMIVIAILHNINAIMLPRYNHRWLMRMIEVIMWTVRHYNTDGGGKARHYYKLLHCFRSY